MTEHHGLSTEGKVGILAAAAKYDVSCSSSGSYRTNKQGGLGDAAACGICHSFTPDGRCISLLKMLLSNKCAYDCLYCANRRSNSISRASLEPSEFCDLAIRLYKRNYIEGIFLSSAVEVSPNHTMERLTEAVMLLRTVHNFHGYIHLKAIPGADPALIERAARHVDRMSVNIELPSEQSLKLLAPSKSKQSVLLPMRQLSSISKASLALPRNVPKSLPAGQTTQLIVGASPEPDGLILRLSQALYRNYSLKRVYYSAYMPVGTSSLLPSVPANLLRENRLYQADWLIRFYGFDAEELTPQDGNLNYDYDPKAAWALNNLNIFPVEVNTAPLELLLRVPGIGPKSAYKIMKARTQTKLTYPDLSRMRVVLKRAKHFITTGGKFYGVNSYNNIGALLTERTGEQLSMFGTAALQAATGEF